MKSCHIVFFLWIGLLLNACSLFETTPTNSKNQKQVKDVGAKARPDNGGPRKRIWILPFLDTDENRPERFRSKSREELIKELNKRGYMLAMDGNDLGVDLSSKLHNHEYHFLELGKTAYDKGISAMVEGKILGLKVKHKADEVGVFRQIKTRFEASIRLRIAAARSGRELFNTTRNVTLEDANIRVPENVSAESLIQSNPELLEKLITDAFIDFQKQIQETIDRLAWSGRLALVRGDEIYLNVGRLSGVQIGDILKVTDEGEEIFDPQTGNFIGKAAGRMKGTLEVISYFGTDGCKAIVHSGNGFKENDHVELY